MRSFALLLALLPAWQTHAIDASIRLVRAQAHAPIAAAVSYDGKSAYRNAESSRPYALGSLTKSFTAAAVLQLAGAGRFSLDDSIYSYVPATTGWHGPSIDTVLAQTAPWPDYSELPGFDATREYTPQQLLSLAGEPGGGQPAIFLYSNSNYVALGLLVEAASGESYAGYVRRHIALPLGLNSVRYAGPSSLFSAGGLSATPADVTLWLNALLTNRLHLAAPLARRFFQTATNDAFASTGYGAGFFVNRTRGRTAYFAPGYAPAGSAYMLALPDSKLEIAVATSTPAFDLQPLALDILDDLEPSAAFLHDDIVSSRLLGRSVAPEGGVTYRYEVVFRDGARKSVRVGYDASGMQNYLFIAGIR